MDRFCKRDFLVAGKKSVWQFTDLNISFKRLDKKQYH